MMENPQRRSSNYYDTNEEPTTEAETTEEDRRPNRLRNRVLCRQNLIRQQNRRHGLETVKKLNLCENPLTK